MHGHKTSHLPIRYFLALLWAHPILHISVIRVKKSLRSAHTMYICVFCMDLRTAIIFLHNIKWSVFITQTEGVYSAVRCLLKYNKFNLSIERLTIKV